MREGNIRQKMIDDLANCDWSRQKLAQQLLEARYQGKKKQLESCWLDQVISVLRGEGEEGRGQDVLYEEFKEDLKTLNNLYLTPKKL
jgi:hypothetical protein